MKLDEADSAFRDFIDVIRALRTPGTGCPWDLEQNHQTLRPYLVEETYEVIDAIDGGDDANLREELGDVLLQVALHSQIAADRNAFCITDVIRGIADKMVRRHPHVFAGSPLNTSAEVMRTWEQIKAAEAVQRGAEPAHADRLGGLPTGLPALIRAQRLGERAAMVSFDWDSVPGLIEQMQTDLARLADRLRMVAESKSPENLRHGVENDLGDFLFLLCQVARRLDVSADDGLRRANNRFVDNFRRMEKQSSRPLAEMSADELQAAWNRAKNQESDR